MIGLAARPGFARACHPALLAYLLIGLGGCIITVSNPPPPTPPPAPITIELVNDSDFVIDANFFVSGTAVDATALFVQQNIYTGYSQKTIPTLGAREQVEFEFACDDVSTLGVSRPVFVNPLTFTGGTSQDEIFLTNGGDFDCGDRLRFIYVRDGDAFRVGVQKQ
jgi:hypothetical protein